MNKLLLKSTNYFSLVFLIIVLIISTGCSAGSAEAITAETSLESTESNSESVDGIIPETSMETSEANSDSESDTTDDAGEETRNDESSVETEETNDTIEETSEVYENSEQDVDDNNTELNNISTSDTDNTDENQNSEESTHIVNKFDGYTLIEVDGGDLSGHRESNVVVDVGFGTREYWAFTNNYGQLVRVIAAEIVLQDDENEPVLSTGRYYPDEAKVPGTESPVLDEGHVIADSLGGVSNAYNITPQECTLNRYGDQAYMEKWIRDAGGCTDFEAIITYSDTETQIPSHYCFTYNLNGNVIVDEFDNVNPDEVNAELEETDSTSEETDNTSEEGVEDENVETANQSDDTSSGLEITRVSLSKEEVDITNNGSDQINLKGYVIVSVTGSQTYTFPDYILAPGSVVTVYARGGEGDLEWCGSYIWNNDGDPAELYSSDGELIDRR